MNPIPDPERANALFSDLRVSPNIEAQLRDRFRRHHRMRRMRRWMMAAPLAAAAGLLVFSLRPPVLPEPHSTEFYPIPGETITAAMLGSSQIIRVELTPEVMAQLGLALQAGPVEAELLLAQDGLARGIRLVP